MGGILRDGDDAVSNFVGVVYSIGGDDNGAELSCGSEFSCVPRRLGLSVVESSGPTSCPSSGGLFLCASFV